MKKSIVATEIKPNRGLNKVTHRFKKFTNVKFCISTRLYSKFKVVGNENYFEDWTEDKYLFEKESLNTLIRDNRWVSILNEMDISTIDFNEFQLSFESLIIDLELKFNKDIRQGSLLKSNLKFILYSTVLLPHPDYREVDKIVEDYFYMKKNLQKYESENPIKIISKKDISIINEIKNQLKKTKIVSFEANQEPVFLIELLLIKQNIRKKYLGEEFRRGNGLSILELQELVENYGINSSSTYERNCSNYRRKSIDEMLFEFNDNCYKEAILFLHTKIEEGDNSFSVSTLDLLLQWYKNRFLHKT